MLATPLMLTGLAVAFAFRCGLFNIGGQGQYFVGFIFALWIATTLEGIPTVLLRAVSAILAGVRWPARSGRDRGISEGDGRRPRGDHDDHAQLDRHLRGSLPLRLGGPLQRRRCSRSRARKDIAEGAKLPVDLGRSIAPGRSTRDLRGLLGPRRLLGRSSIARRSDTRCAPSASTRRPPATAGSASRGTISSRWRSRAASPALAGCHRRPRRGSSAVDVSNIQASHDRVHRHRRRAPRPEHSRRRRPRRAPVRRARGRDFVAAISTRASSTPDLASNLATIIQALVIFFVGAELLILSLWACAREAARSAACAGGRRREPTPPPPRRAGRLGRGRASGSLGVACGLLAFLVRFRPSRANVAVPLVVGSSLALSASARSRAASAGSAPGRLRWPSSAIWSACLATAFERETLEASSSGQALIAAMLRFATPLAFAALGGIFSERSRRREHRTRGDDAHRRVLRASGART